MKKSALPIATPCGENWEAMSPDGGGRLCATCDKVVHDLSSMSEAKAKRLLANKGSLCVRYLFDAHGNVWFAGDEPPLAARLLNRAKRGAAIAAALAVPFTLQACMGSMPASDYEEPESGDAGHVGSDPVVGEDAGDAGAQDDDAATDAGIDPTDGGDEDGGDGGL